MRTIWIVGAATAALVLAGAALPSPPMRTALLRAQVFSEWCGPKHGDAMRAGMSSALRAGQAYAQTLPGDMNAPPPLVPGLGDAHLDITTTSPEARQFFDQGLRYNHAFNHGEAIRAFRQAQRLDPQCAICYWGEAFALGPNINAPMESGAFDPAYAAARAANARKAGASPLEQALIDAIQTRYARRAPANRAPLDVAFADAMNAVADRFPDNDEVQDIAAEAAMDTQPWDYWAPGGREPKGRAGPAIQRIETVLARSPNNVGAMHLYIHLAEASTDPWRAEEAANRLGAQAPMAGHLVHMPGHIYYRVGRFRDSINVNLTAVATDEAYIANADPTPVYRYGYYPHNVHFVLTSAAMAGDARLALDYAEKLDQAVPIEMARNVVLAQPVKAAPWFARAQFAPPATIIGAREPPSGVSFVTGAWRYARGVALARIGSADGARAEAAAMQQLIASGDFAAMNTQGIPAQDILQVYRHLVLGRAFMAENNFRSAIAELRQAADLQDHIPYTEPPYIYYPIRRTLGAAYLLNNQPAVAEQEFLQTLINSPNDAYAYWGLSEARRMRNDRVGQRAALDMFNAAYLGDRRRMDARQL